MKRLLLSGLMSLVSFSIFASHFAGGELRYEFNGSNYSCYLALYQMCGGANLPTQAIVNFKSVSTSQNFNVTFNLVNYDTVNPACPPALSKCQSITATIPGYVTGNYAANVTLPTHATDWVMSTQLAARALTNNISTSSISFYLETAINDSTAINSSPWVPNKPNYFMTVNQTMYIPLQGLDAEGDSVAFEIIPAMSAAGANVTYGNGFSGTNPFGAGGTCQIINNKTLKVKSTAVGNYTVAFRIKDYRNGVQVGSYIREMMFSVLSGNITLTFPTPTTSSVFTVYTCPGQSNNVTVNFMDSTSTDSVIVTIIPPAMSGWSFTPTATNGLASASANITWTTPTTLNPATLPHFYIHIRTRDNGCPRAYADYSILVRTRPCTADSVWPGDANGDKTVNIYDPLAIAIAYGSTGPTRSGATTTWTAQAATNWGTTYVTNNIDYKHGDCNGDGIIDTADASVVTINWGQWHLKGTGTGNKITGAPDLYMDITGIDFVPGTTVTIPIKLGSSASPVNNIYGLATVIFINGMMSSATPVLNTSNSWIGNTTNTLNFNHVTTNNAIHWSYARTDHQNRSGQGAIATLKLTIPSDMNIGDKVYLGFNMTKLVDKDGKEITQFNETTTIATIVPVTSVNNLNGNLQNMFIVPNPSSSNAVLNFNLTDAGNVSISVIDIVGKKVWQHSENYSAGMQKVKLPSNLTSGMYTIQLNGEKLQPKTAKWIKE